MLHSLSIWRDTLRQKYAPHHAERCIEQLIKYIKDDIMAAVGIPAESSSWHLLLYYHYSIFPQGFHAIGLPEYRRFLTAGVNYVFLPVNI
jgi:hypothetical protein